VLVVRDADNAVADRPVAVRAVRTVVVSAHALARARERHSHPPNGIALERVIADEVRVALAEGRVGLHFPRVFRGGASDKRHRVVTDGARFVWNSERTLGFVIRVEEDGLVRVLTTMIRRWETNG
jgi:hypothetical protein